jgi:hypothetical protein
MKGVLKEMGKTPLRRVGVKIFGMNIAEGIRMFLTSYLRPLYSMTI